MSKHIRKGDQVLVIAGNDRGKIGKVLTRLEDKVVVEGINVRKKHMRRTQQNQKGQIIDIERPIHISNIRPCVDEKPVKLARRRNADGSSEVYYKDGKSEALFRSSKKSKGE